MGDYGGRTADDAASLLRNLSDTGLPNKVVYDSENEPDWEDLNKLDPEITNTPEREIAIENSDKRLTTLTSIVENMLTVDGLPFSFKGRQYLKGLYDPIKEFPIGSRNQLWVAGRQVEKCVPILGMILMADGTLKKAGDMRLGDLVAAVNRTTLNSTSSSVSWVSALYKKPCYKITTRMGRAVTVGEEHPLLSSDEWVQAKDLKIKDKLCWLKRWQTPTGVAEKSEVPWARVCGWLIAEGGLTQLQWGFTNKDLKVLEDFKISMLEVYPACSWSVSVDARNGVTTYRISADTRAILEQRLAAGSSFTHRIPDWIWIASLEVKANFINRLWGGDGYCAWNNNSKWDISYCSVSKELIKDLQHLLTQFGIPARIRSFVPTLYKGTDNVAWELRIETRQGCVDFVNKIGAFGKTPEKIEYVKKESNNRHTLPKKAVQRDIDAVYGQARTKGDETLGAHGLRRKLKYAPTAEKIRQYVDAFKELGLDTSRLDRWLNDDVGWDEVVSVEFVGMQECVDFTVENTHTFVIDGLVTHNSTSQSAKSAALGTCYSAFKTLYVAPRFDQVTVFSQQRFKPMCEDSAPLRRWCKPHKMLWQVGAKQFANGSFFNFRSCYLSPDGSRGISAHHLMIDEIQDIISDNIAVLEQCQSHADEESRYNSYAGTPKTNSNVITRRWENTCQFEWLSKCSACNHWNYLDDRIVGEYFYECTRCKREFNPHIGMWVPQKPDFLNVRWGFRISQIMVPFKRHKDIKAVRDDPQVSRKRYYNECLGLPFDDGELALTKRDMEVACANGDGQGPWSPAKATAAARKGVKFFAGVDYGSGESASSSFTFLTIGFRHPHTGKFQVVYMKKFTGDDTSLAKQPKIIHEICSQYHVSWIGADWGFGAALNKRLEEEFGWDRFRGEHLLLEYSYVNQKLIATWNGKGLRYTVDRTQCMTALIDAIRTGKVVFFRQAEMERYFSDFTSIFSEFNEKTGIMVYDHTMPDDGFHSTNYAFMAMKQFYESFVPTMLPNIPR